MDIGLNKEIKQYIRNVDINLRISYGNIRPPIEEENRDLFIYIWLNKIKIESIVNSFRRRGISVKMDGSENNLVNIRKLFWIFLCPDDYIKSYNQEISRKESNKVEQQIMN